MRYFANLILLFSIFACSKEAPKEILIDHSNINLKKKDGGWEFKNHPFSGFMVERESDGRIVHKLPILNGKENGMAKAWYNTGEKLLERTFVDGKKEGKFTQWWPNGKIRYLFYYKNDQFNGSQLVFFPNGNKRELSNYWAGEKEGIQRVWDEQGALISNYTIRNKKLYGIISVKSCIPIGH